MKLYIISLIFSIFLYIPFGCFGQKHLHNGFIAATNRGVYYLQDGFNEWVSFGSIKFTDAFKPANGKFDTIVSVSFYKDNFKALGYKDNIDLGNNQGIIAFNVFGKKLTEQYANSYIWNNSFYEEPIQKITNKLKNDIFVIEANFNANTVYDHCLKVFNQSGSNIYNIMVGGNVNYFSSFATDNDSIMVWTGTNNTLYKTVISATVGYRSNTAITGLTSNAASGHQICYDSNNDLFLIVSDEGFIYSYDKTEITKIDTIETYYGYNCDSITDIEYDTHDSILYLGLKYSDGSKYLGLKYFYSAHYLLMNWIDAVSTNDILLAKNSEGEILYNPSNNFYTYSDFPSTGKDIADLPSGTIVYDLDYIDYLPWVDVNPPVITLVGDNPDTIFVGSTYVDAGATALDETDGDITANIVVVDGVNENIVGTYYVTYNVSDAKGNNATEVIRTVVVINDPNAFIMEFAMGAGETLTIPLNPNLTGYNFTVDWGDGSPLSTINAYDDADLSHTYTNAGNYQTSLLGTVKGIYFNFTGNCLNLTKIINWGNCGFTTFNMAFIGCSNLSVLPNGGITGATAVSEYGFWFAFSDCGFTSLPADLFRYCTAVSIEGFYGTFSDCTSLVSIPTDLFRYNTLASTNGFAYTFYNCTSLASLPADLFRYNVNVSTGGFDATFSDCTSLASLPADLFRYNVNVSSNGFANTFYGCTSLASLPNDLFRYNVNVSSSGFLATFSGCISLASLPNDLFRYNVNVSSSGFDGTFYGCTKLQLNANIFYANGEQSTRFLNKSVSFINCFGRSLFTGTQGTAPDLWNCNFRTGNVTKTNCFDGAGNSTTSLTNYNSIPAAWK